MSTLNTHFGAAAIEAILHGKGAVYFIGVGGINMSSLALLTKQRGFHVGGSDRTRTPLTDRLTDAGVEIFYTHDGRHLEGYDAVVYTVAIPEDNPEMSEARRRGLPLISRADYLGWIMTGYAHRVGISGMHGKSTCTSMCAQIFIEAQTDPTVVSGAEMGLLDGAYRISEKHPKEHFIFEACEYMDSFLDFNPNVAVILNLEMDHVDYFKNMEQITRSFASFAGLSQAAGGVTVYNEDDQWVLRAMRDYAGPTVTFGMRPTADYYATAIVYEKGLASFDIHEKGNFLCHVDLRVPGMHNVYNALAATATARLYSIPGETIGSALSHFIGAKRRMEYKGKFLGIDVYDDYGHHPTEVRTTLRGAADMGYARVWCVYQPHTYSRTSVLYNQFTEAFEQADRVLMIDIYAAREANIWGVSSEQLAADIGEKATYCGTVENALELLRKDAQPGDLILVMGAGNVNKIFDLMDLRDRTAPSDQYKTERNQNTNISYKGKEDFLCPYVLTKKTKPSHC